MDLYHNKITGARRGAAQDTVPPCRAEALEKAENIIRGLTAVFTGSELTGEEKDELYRRITMIYVESKEKTFIKA